MASPIFTFEQASALIGRVRRMTQAADERLRELRAQAEGMARGSDAAERLSEQMNEAVQAWAESIEALGAVAKGIWTVDFDSGRGFYYCWSFNELALTHYHTYEAGFPGRKPLIHGEPPDDADVDPPPLLN